jgi:hypothetical protein
MIVYVYYYVSVRKSVSYSSCAVSVLSNNGKM